MNKCEEILNKMTLEEKVYQMTCVRSANGINRSGNGIDIDKVKELADRGVLGLLDASLIKINCTQGIEGFVSLLNEFYEKSENKVWLWIPAEGGIGNFYDFGTRFPSLMALGATRSEELAYKMGNAIASECRILGATLSGDLVLDVNSNADNPIINTRAISDNTDLVIKIACSYLKGTQAVKIISGGYHFPGHGDTRCDSHLTMPIVEHSKEFLLKRELRTFKEMIDAGIQAIGTSHVLFPALLDLEEGKIAATISRNIITKLLKEEFGFKGLVFSDSLTMKGIADMYEVGRLAVLAIKAGHDVILSNYEEDPQITVDAIIKAVKNEEIDITQINESVLKILIYREQFDTLYNKPLDIDNVKSVIGCDEHKSIAKEVADKSITLLENESIEFCPESIRKALIIAVKDEADGIVKDMGTILKSKANYLFESCKKYCSHTDIKLISSKPDKEEIEKILSMAKDYDIVLYGVFTRVVAYKEDSSIISDEQVEFINALSRCIKNSVIAIFGNPYVLKKIVKPQNCLCAYSECDYSIESCLKVIFGKIKATGKLPVNINERYCFGYGI